MFEIVDEKRVIYKKGSNPGGWVRLEDSPYIWYVKEGEAKNAVTKDGNPAEYSRSIGAIVEVYAASLYRLLADDKNIVDALIHKEDNGHAKYKVASQLVEGYAGIEESIVNGGKRVQIPDSNNNSPSLDSKPVVNLNKVVAIRTLIGDYDFANMQNIGYKDLGESIQVGSIDFGKAFQKPEIAYIHSSKPDEVVNFSQIITEPKAPTWLFIFRELLEGLTPEKELQIADRFNNTHLEGSGRVKPGMIPHSDTIIFPFPEAMANPKELLQTFREITDIPLEEIQKLTDHYEGMIVEYIRSNNLNVEFNKGQLIAPVLERVELIREHLRGLELEAGRDSLSESLGRIVTDLNNSGVQMKNDTSSPITPSHANNLKQKNDIPPLPGN